jgi:hypothetical protein
MENDRGQVMYKKLHIFTLNGQTYTFKAVREFNFNESVITFTFTAQSDGMTKRGLFFVKNIAGFTYEER